MKPINLHAHTKFSDGANTMEDMVLAYIENGFICACFTDHDYFFYKLPSEDDAPTHKDDGTELILSEVYNWRWERAVFNCWKLDEYFKEGKRLQDKYKYPVICGIEISCGNGEEACLFGEEACREWFKERSYIKKSQDWANANFKKYNYALNWNHPRPNIERHSVEFTSQFHTIEIVNNAQLFVKDISKLKDIEAKHVRALDAHSVKMSFKKQTYKSTWNSSSSRKNKMRTHKPHFKRPGCCSFVPFSLRINDENDLISFIRNSKQKDWMHKGKVRKELL